MSAGRSALVRAGATALLVFALDQLSKSWVRGNVIVGERRDILGPLDLVNVRNKGVAFGALTGAGWIVPALTVVALLGVSVWFGRTPTAAWAWLPAGLVVGGALGNLYDRLTHGQVTDFIKVPYWPAFNVADIAITCGVILLILVAEFDGRNPKSPSS